MPVNVATIFGGPALAIRRAARFYSKSDIRLTSSKETFTIEVDRFGPVDERVRDEILKAAFTPAGEFEALGELWPYAGTLLGSLVTPQSQAIEAINTTSNEVTITGHGLSTGDAVLVHVATGGTLPALGSGALSPSTVYYVAKVDADTFTLHPTYADAIAGPPATNPIDFTDDGTGTVYVDRDHPLVLHTFDGKKLTLHNAAVTRMPGLRLSSVESIIGDVEFEAFLRNGFDWTNAAARLTIEEAALSDTSFDPAGIITQPYSGAWGATAPWNSFQTKDGFKIDFDLQLEPVQCDGLGTISRRLKSLAVTVKATPLGISESQLITKLLVQGAGASRGRSLAGDDLVITGTGVYVAIRGAALTEGPQSFGSGTDRVGELTWKATRTFTGGAPNDLFYIGTAAP
jgi:hypothetical protein